MLPMLRAYRESIIFMLAGCHAAAAAAACIPLIAYSYAGWLPALGIGIGIGIGIGCATLSFFAARCTLRVRMRMRMVMVVSRKMLSFVGAGWRCAVLCCPGVVGELAVR
jgi:hypothetical protein